MVNKQRITNKTFAEENQPFRDACKKAILPTGLVGLPPTTRQASKYRNKKGLAYQAQVYK